jgi:predicted dithiol-disulfide oxidoreductase (DUF899 family)
MTEHATGTREEWLARRLELLAAEKELTQRGDELAQNYKQRMGWSIPCPSSLGSDFNYDFDVSLSEERERSGVSEYNFRESPIRAQSEDVSGPFEAWATMAGADWATYARERPGMSAFALEDGIGHHTYSAYARGLDGLWGMYQWLDRAPRGRNETCGPDDPLNWFRRHDEYNR